MVCKIDCKLWMVMLVILIISGNALAEERIKTKFTWGLDWRNDHLNWDIAGSSNGTDPNVLSELTWRKIKSRQVQSAQRVLLFKHWQIKNAFNYAWINSGENQDSDFLGDNRTFQFSQSDNRADKGSLWDWSLGGGYRWQWDRSGLALTPLAGYSKHRQNFSVTDGRQTLADFGFRVPLGPFSGLNSRYRSSWKSWWLGSELEWTHKRLNVFGSGAYHFARYQGVGDWNLRRDFAHPKSFEHQADGSGLELEGLGQYKLSAHWGLVSNFRCQKWRTVRGLDRTFFSDGEILDTRLNGAYWRSWSIGGGVMYSF